MDYAVYDRVRTQLIEEWNANDGHPVGKEPFLTSHSFFRLPKGVSTVVAGRSGGLTEVLLAP